MGHTGVELREDATKRPHVNCAVIWQPHDHLRRAVESRLDVAVHRLLLKARRAKVDDLHGAPPGGDEEDILGLEVAVDDGVL